MSVSLALVPVALTLRLVMGKENFHNWVNSMQVKEPAAFKHELELVRTVRLAGYDAEQWGGSIKTHINGEKLFFFWENVNGKWSAVFAKSDPRPLIERFMADINRAAGRQVFRISGVQETELRETVEAKAEISAATVAPPLPAAASVFPTNFRDRELLFRTLKEFGNNPVYEGDDIVCKVEQSLLTFRQTGDEPFLVEICDDTDLRKVFDYLSDVDDDYRRCVQAVVYEKLKERAVLKHMTIEAEEVLEDNSIVITLNIGS